MVCLCVVWMSVCSLCVYVWVCGMCVGLGVYGCGCGWVCFYVCDCVCFCVCFSVVQCEVCEHVHQCGLRACRISSIVLFNRSQFGTSSCFL